jgi:hypothetical protein
MHHLKSCQCPRGYVYTHRLYDSAIPPQRKIQLLNPRHATSCNRRSIAKNIVFINRNLVMNGAFGSSSLQCTVQDIDLSILRYIIRLTVVVSRMQVTILS